MYHNTSSIDRKRSAELFLRYFYTAKFSPERGVLREYVTEFTCFLLNPFERNEKKYVGVVKKRTNRGAIYIKNVRFWEKELISANIAF